MSCNKVLPQRAGGGIVQTLSYSTGKKVGNLPFYVENYIKYKERNHS